jgi:hypothetical protein
MIRTGYSDCLYYLEPVGKRAAVRLVCACGQSHGAASWKDVDSALASGILPPVSVAKWATDPRVGATSKLAAKRCNALAKAQAAWPYS